MTRETDGNRHTPKKSKRLLRVESVIKGVFKGTWIYTRYKIQFNILKFAGE